MRIWFESGIRVNKLVVSGILGIYAGKTADDGFLVFSPLCSHPARDGIVAGFAKGKRLVPGKALRAGGFDGVTHGLAAAQRRFSTRPTPPVFPQSRT